MARELEQMSEGRLARIPDEIEEKQNEKTEKQTDEMKNMQKQFKLQQKQLMMMQQQLIQQQARLPSDGPFPSIARMPTFLFTAACPRRWRPPAPLASVLHHHRF
jgi:hypothetical protein